MLYLSTGYDTPNMLAIRVDGKGDVTDSHIAWTLKRVSTGGTVTVATGTTKLANPVTTDDGDKITDVVSRITWTASGDAAIKPGQFQEFPGPSEYHMTRIGEQTGGAITNMEPGKKGTRAYFDVDDVNAGAARGKELGGEADQPMPVPNMGWFATCRDPHGNEFGLWQTDPSAQAPQG